MTRGQVDIQILKQFPRQIEDGFYLPLEKYMKENWDFSNKLLSQIFPIGSNVSKGSHHKEKNCDKCQSHYGGEGG